MKKLIFLSSALMAVYFFSCKKDRVAPAPTPPTTQNSSISSFFAKNGVPNQSFVINSTNYQTINGAGGTMISIYPNAFVTQTNQPVTGDVIIELREIFSKKDMILSDAPTTSGGMPLTSGGEIYFSAKQNNEELKLATNSTVFVKIPAGQTPSYQMQEFYARKLDANTDWNPAPTATVMVTQDTVNSTNYYYFQIDSVKWINCDYFSNDPAPKTNISVNPGTAYNDTNCVVFISVDGRNSVGRLYYSNGSYRTNNWPVGKAVTFIAISKIGEQHYVSIKSTVITNNHNEILNLSPTTESQIKQDLSNLP